MRRYQGFEVEDYVFTLDALPLKPSRVCNIGVKRVNSRFDPFPLLCNKGTRNESAKPTMDRENIGVKARLSRDGVAGNLEDKNSLRGHKSDKQGICIQR